MFSVAAGFGMGAVVKRVDLASVKRGGAKVSEFA